MKLKMLKYLSMLALMLFVFASCDQDSIFADISVEPPPVKPRVSGSPTKLVEYGSAMYVATINSKKIHRLSSGSWSSLDPGGNVLDLAEGSDGLYVLTYDNNVMNTALKIYDGSWSTINTGSGSVQSIYGANGTVFAGVGSAGSVHYLDGTALNPITGVTGVLNGVAYNGTNYYIATSDGIYQVNSSHSVTATYSFNNVKGIIRIGDTTNIAAVTWDGRILYGTNFASSISSSNLNYTGAMTFWDNPSAGDNLLLLGVHNTGSYDRGYRECTLDGSGHPTSGTLKFPGDSNPSSVNPNDKSKYEASLARYSVYSILQFGDRIYASTTVNGLYVLKDGQWNAQD